MTEEAKGTKERAANWARRQVEEAMRGVRYGQVTVVIQDGVVVQVERTEKRRFERRKGDC